MTSDVIRRWRELAGPSATPAPRTQSLSWWGVMMLVLTEAALFAVMVASYFYLRWKSAIGWPQGDIADPKLARPIAFTAALVVSSGSMLLAQRAARRGGQAALVGALGLTLALALTFLGLQAWDYVEKAKEFTPGTNTYASLVYLLTGLHAAHVAVGALLLAWIWFRAARGAYPPWRHDSVSTVALYWHFVVALAVVIFATVVVSPYL